MTERTTPLTITLLRHGKAETGDMTMDDFDRPLAERGWNEATAIAAYMQAKNLSPDLTLCSPARRTRETWEGLEKAGIQGQVEYENELYLASAGTLLARLAQLDGSVKHCLLIGHNPGLHQLSGQLSVEGETEAIRNLIMQFPPCSLTTIDCGSDATLGGTLRHFITPKMLP